MKRVINWLIGMMILVLLVSCTEEKTNGILSPTNDNLVFQKEVKDVIVINNNDSLIYYYSVNLEDSYTYNENTIIEEENRYNLRLYYYSPVEGAPIRIKIKYETSDNKTKTIYLEPIWKVYYNL